MKAKLNAETIFQRKIEAMNLACDNAVRTANAVWDKSYHAAYASYRKATERKAKGGGK